jgi:hypothetical protein
VPRSEPGCASNLVTPSDTCHQCGRVTSVRVTDSQRLLSLTPRFCCHQSPVPARASSTYWQARQAELAGLLIIRGGFSAGSLLVRASLRDGLRPLRPNPTESAEPGVTFVDSPGLA